MLERVYDHDHDGGKYETSYPEITVDTESRRRPRNSKEKVFSWVVKLHDAVNKRRGCKVTSDVNFWAKEYARLRKAKRPVTMCICRGKETCVLKSGKL